MQRVLTMTLLFLLFGCGDRIRDPLDNTEQLLLGMWDSVSNTPNVCHERIKLNADHTFWWFDKSLSTGTYEHVGDRLNFMFTNKAWENIKFSVTDRELYLSRVGVPTVYTRVPLSVTNISPCPKETSPSK